MKKVISSLLCICMLLSMLSSFGGIFAVAATPSVDDAYKPLFDSTSAVYGNTMVVIPSLDTSAETVSYFFGGVTVTEDYSASRHFSSYAAALAYWETKYTGTALVTNVPNFILTAGTYTETITVRYNANIYGAQAGITPNDPSYNPRTALPTADWGENPARLSENETVLTGKIFRANTKDASNTDTTYSQVLVNSGVKTQVLNIDGIKSTHTTGIDIDDVWIAESSIVTNDINVYNSVFSGNKHVGHAYYDGSRNDINYYFEECLITGTTDRVFRYWAQEIVLHRVNVENSASGYYAGAIWYGATSSNGNECVYNKVGGSKYLLYKATDSRFANLGTATTFCLSDYNYAKTLKLDIDGCMFADANSTAWGIFRVDADNDSSGRFPRPGISVKNSTVYSSTQKNTVFNGGDPYQNAPYDITFNYNKVIGYGSMLPNSTTSNSQNTKIAGSKFNFDYNYIAPISSYTGANDWNGTAPKWNSNATGTSILDISLVPYYFDYGMTTSSDMLKITGASFSDAAETFEINEGGKLISAIIADGDTWENISFTTSITGASVSVTKDDAAVTSISASAIEDFASYDVTVSYRGVSVTYKLEVYSNSDIVDFTALTPTAPLKNTAALLTTETYAEGESVVVLWQGALTRFVYGTNAFNTVAAARAKGFTQMVLSMGEYSSIEITDSIELYGEDYATNPNKKYAVPELPWDLADEWKETVTKVTGAVKLTSATAGKTVKIMGIELYNGGYLDDDNRSTTATKATTIIENVYVNNTTSSNYSFYSANSKNDELIIRNLRYNNTKSRFMSNAIAADITIDGAFFCENYNFWGYPQYTATQTKTRYTIKNSFFYRYGGNILWSYFQGHCNTVHGGSLDTEFAFTDNIMIDCFDDRSNDTASGGFNASLGGTFHGLTIYPGAFKKIDITGNTFISTWDLFANVLNCLATDVNPNSGDMSEKITFDRNRMVGMRPYIYINSDTETVSGTANYYARYTDGYQSGVKGEEQMSALLGKDYYLDYNMTTLASEMKMKTDRAYSMTNDVTKEASVIIGKDEIYTSDLYTARGDKFLLYSDADCENAVSHITANMVGEGKLFYAKATSKEGVPVIYKLYVSVGDAKNAVEPTKIDDINNPYLYYLNALDMPVGTKFVMKWNGTDYLFTAGVNAFANVSKILAYHNKTSSGVPNVIMPAGVYTNQVTLTKSVNFYGEGGEAVTEMKPFSESKAIRIACVGDSITEGQGVAAADREQYGYPGQLETKLNALYGEGSYEVKNCGWGGSTINIQTNRETNSYTYWTYIYTAQYFQALDFNPDIVTIMMGHNDANMNFWTTTQGYKDMYQKIIDTFEALPSKPVVVVIGSTHTLSGGIRGTLFEDGVIKTQKELARENSTLYIDAYSQTYGMSGDKTLFTDGIHMTAKGYDLLSDIVLDGLTPILKDTRTATYTNIDTDDTLVPSETDKIKVACIGDSFTYGDKEYAGYPVYLQQYLGTKGYEVRSYGEDGATLIDSKDGTLKSSSNPWCYDNTSRGKASFEWDPDIVIITLGTNDGGSHMTSYHNLSWTLDADGNTVTWGSMQSTAAQEYMRDYARLIAQYRSQGATRIIVSSNPRNGNFVDIMQKVAADNDCEFINTYQTTKSWDSSYSNGTNKNGVSDGHFSAKGYKAYGRLIAESLFPEFATYFCDTEGEIENTAIVFDPQGGSYIAGQKVTYNWEGRAYTFTWGENAFNTVDEIIAKVGSGKVQILIPENTVTTTGAGFTISASADTSKITAIEVYGQNRKFDPNNKSMASNDPTADWTLSSKWDSYSEKSGTSAVGKITVSSTAGFGKLLFKGITMRDIFTWTTRTSGNTDITFENVRVDCTSGATGYLINNNSTWTKSGAVNETMTLKNMRIDDYRRASGRLWNSNNSNNLLMDGVYVKAATGYSFGAAYYQSSNAAPKSDVLIIGCNFRDMGSPSSIAPAQAENQANVATITIKNNVFYNVSGNATIPIYPYFVDKVNYEGNYFILPSASSMTFGLKFSTAITSGDLSQVMDYKVINNNFVVKSTSVVAGATINADTPVDMTGNYVATYTADYQNGINGVAPQFNKSSYDYYYLDFARTVKNTDVYLKSLAMESVVEDLVIGESNITGKVQLGQKITDLSAVCGNDKVTAKFYSDSACTSEATSLDYSVAKAYYVKVSFGSVSKVYSVNFAVGDPVNFKAEFEDESGIIKNTAIALIPTATTGTVLAQWQGTVYEFTAGENAFASWSAIAEKYSGEKVQIILPAGTYNSHINICGPWEIYGENYKVDPNTRTGADVTLNTEWGTYGDSVLVNYADIVVDEAATPVDSDVEIIISGIRMSRYFNATAIKANEYKTTIVLRNIVYDRNNAFVYEEFNAKTGNASKDEFRIENMHFMNKVYRNSHSLIVSNTPNTVVIDGLCVPSNATTLGNITLAGENGSFELKNSFFKDITSSTSVYPYVVKVNATNGANAVFENNTFINCGKDDAENGSNCFVSVDQAAFDKVEFKDNTAVCTKDGDHRFIEWQTADTVDYSDKITFNGNRIIGLMPAVVVNENTDIDLSENYFAKYTDDYAEVSNGDIPADTDADYYLDFAKTTLKSDLVPSGVNAILETDTLYTYAEAGVYSFSLGADYTVYSNTACTNKVTSTTVKVGEASKVYVRAATDNASYVFTMYVMGVESLSDVENAKTYNASVYYPTLYGASNGIKVIAYDGGVPYVFETGRGVVTTDGQFTFSNSNVLIPDNITAKTVYVTGDVYLVGQNADKITLSKKQMKIGAVGDSITYGAQATNVSTDAYPVILESYLGSDYDVGNFGHAGATVQLLANGAERQYQIYGKTKYDNSIAYNPDVIIIGLGTNDLDTSRWKSNREYVDQYIDLIDDYMALEHKPMVFVTTAMKRTDDGTGVKQMRTVENLIPLQKMVADAVGGQVIDTYTYMLDYFNTTYIADKLHPNTKGYKILGEFIGDELKNLMNEQITLDTVSVTIKDDFTLNVKTGVTKYDDIYAVINGEKVEEYAVDANGKLSFAFDGIAPHKLGDNVNATVCVVKGGITSESEPLSFSVKDYCYAVLEGDYEQNVKTVAKDILNYGAAAQTYKNYNTDALVNSALTDEQKQIAKYELTNVTDTDFAVCENASAVWSGAGLYLESSINIRLSFKAENADGLSVKVTDKDGNVLATVTDIHKGLYGKYYFYFDGLDASMLGDELYFTVMSGEDAVSNTLCYSAESYAAQMADTENAALATLLDSIVAYGRSAQVL